MRRFGVVLLAALLMVTGCRSTGSRGSGSASAGPAPKRTPSGREQPFWADASAPASPAARNNGSTGPLGPNNKENVASAEMQGILAGTLKDGFDRPPSQAFIKVSPVDASGTPGQGKQIGVEADRDGAFFISGLVPGKTYMLTVQAKDGDRVLAGSAQVRPPYTRLLIPLREGNVSTLTEQPPPHPGKVGPFAAPDKKPADKENGPPPPDPVPDNDPLAPNKLDQSWAPGRAAPPASRTPPPKNPLPRPANPSTIADGPHSPRVPVPVNIRPKPSDEPGGQPPPPPPVTPYQPPPPPAAESSFAPPPPAIRVQDGQEGGGNRLASVSQPPPPSLASRPMRLNFRVYDPQGRPWELKDHSGRLVLVEFWSTTCAPCMRSLPEMKRLVQEFGGSGLEVIGIACEDGPWGQVARSVDEVHSNRGLNYRVFLDAERGTNAARSIFRVQYLPTLVLLRSDGEVLWRGGSQDFGLLRGIVRQQLGGR